MVVKKGFDTDKYLILQKKEILKRAAKFNRLYLEFGGHLCYDGHASRVLPGYRPKLKIELLKNIKDLEIIYCVSAKDLNTKKRLGDFKLDYKKQTLQDLISLRKSGLKVSAVTITRYSGEKHARDFGKLLAKKYNIYFSPEMKNYLKGARYAYKGYKNYPYIPVKSKIVVVTGAAGGSGKMATAMSQMYHEGKIGKDVGYAKFETFPIWNLPINHPINIAYEAATADLGDFLEYDPYHFKAYGIKAVNYNRDIQNFAILMKIAKLITKKKDALGYKSPTDMGISQSKKAIINDKICRKAALNEIKRRWKRYNSEYKAGREFKKTILRMRDIMKKAKIL